MPATLETPSAPELQTRILTAYVVLSEKTRSPDVPVSKLYEAVGGNLEAFHEALREACYDHHAVPTSGEPAFADAETLRRALRIEGETFLNVKFLPANASRPRKDATGKRPARGSKARNTPDPAVCAAGLNALIKTYGPEAVLEALAQRCDGLAGDLLRLATPETEAQARDASLNWTNLAHSIRRHLGWMRF